MGGKPPNLATLTATTGRSSRTSPRDAGVLGHKGYSAGSHWWDVDVGGNTAWVVGVAGESVKRKEKVPSVQKNGYVTVYFYRGMYFAGTSPLTRLNLKTKPQRIRVLLECDKGRVSFSNAAAKTPIYTFKHTFTEKVHPYLWVGCKPGPHADCPAPSDFYFLFFIVFSL